MIAGRWDPCRKALGPILKLSTNKICLNSLIGYLLSILNSCQRVGLGYLRPGLKPPISQKTLFIFVAKIVQKVAKMGRLCTLGHSSLSLSLSLCLFSSFLFLLLCLRPRHDLWILRDLYPKQLHQMLARGFVMSRLPPWGSCKVQVSWSVWSLASYQASKLPSKQASKQAQLLLLLLLHLSTNLITRALLQCLVASSLASRNLKQLQGVCEEAARGSVGTPAQLGEREREDMSCTPGTVYLDQWLIILYTSCRNCLNNRIIFLCVQFKPASCRNSSILDFNFLAATRIYLFIYTSASTCRNELWFLVAFKASLIPLELPMHDQKWSAELVIIIGHADELELISLSLSLSIYIYMQSIASCMCRHRYWIFFWVWFLCVCVCVCVQSWCSYKLVNQQLNLLIGDQELLQRWVELDHQLHQFSVFVCVGNSA